MIDSLAGRLTTYLKFVKWYFNYKKGRKAPIFASYNVTYRCNLRCSFCYAYNNLYPELNTRDSIEVIEQICELGVPLLDFSGGEPFLRPDLEALALRAKEYGCMTSVNTNGTLINEQRAKKAAKAFDYITVSIDGPSEFHDKVRGVKGTYEKAMRGVRLLKRENVKVGIGSVILPENLELLIEMIPDLIDDVDYITVQPVYPPPLLTSPKLNELIDLLIDIKRRKPSFIPLPNAYINGISDYFKGRISKVCDAISLYFSISPNGEVLACGARNDIVLGNLFEKGLKDILSDPPREAVVKVSKCKGCWLDCTVGVSLSIRRPIEMVKSYIGLS